MTLSAINDELAQAATKKKEFLAQIDRIIPWSKWIGMILPHYYKGERGNKPYDLELMLRIYLVQNLYDLSDMASMTEVIDSRAFSEFCGVDSSNQVPDGDTIGKFRSLLAEHGLQEKLFGQVVQLLSKRCLILKKGTIVDSTIIAAPPSTKSHNKQRDPDAHQVKNGNTWHFGYKAHIGVDKETGLAHHVEVTGANVHDVAMVPKLLTGEETRVYGDSGYLGAEKREDAVTHNKQGRKIKYKTNRRPSQSKNCAARSQAQIKRREHEKSSVRAKVEHVFGIVKGLFRYRKTRYRGLRKQSVKLNMLFALANLYLADKRGLLARFGLSLRQIYQHRHTAFTSLWGSLDLYTTLRGVALNIYSKKFLSILVIQPSFFRIGHIHSFKKFHCMFYTLGWEITCKKHVINAQAGFCTIESHL
jgi:IS5 family transposase